PPPAALWLRLRDSAEVAYIIPEPLKPEFEAKALRARVEALTASIRSPPTCNECPGRAENTSARLFCVQGPVLNAQYSMRRTRRGSCGEPRRPTVRWGLPRSFPNEVPLRAVDGTFEEPVVTNHGQHPAPPGPEPWW